MLKLELRILLFFSALLVITPLGYSELILDNSLLPKFLGFATTLILGIVLFNKEISNNNSSLNYLDISLISYIAFQFLSIFQAINKPDAIYEALKLFLMGTCYFLVKLLLNERKKKVFQAIAIGAFLATLIALFTSIDDLFTAFRMRVDFSAANYTITGLFGHKNMLSNWFLFLIPLNGIGLIIPNKTPKLLFKLALAIQLIMIGLLMTRAVYLGLLISGFICFIIYKYRTETAKKIIQLISYALFTILSISLLLVFFNKFPNLIEFDTTKSSSAIERLLVWKKTIGVIKDNFWLGVGAGNWKVWLPNEGLEGLRRTLDGTTVFSRPHNDYLWVWVESGIVGFLTFLAVLFFSIKTAWNKLFENETLNKPLLFAFCGLVGYLVISFFDFPKERIEANITLALFLAIISTEAKLKIKQTSLQLNSKLISTLAVPVLIFACYFSWVRVESETNMRKAMEAKDRGDQPGLRDYINKAQNKFYLADNNGVPVCWYTGIAHFNLNEKEQASKNFKKAYEINPFNFNVCNNAGTAFFIEGDYVEAEKFYLETLRINPFFDDAKLNLSACYINTNQKEKARVWLNKVTVNSSRLQELKGFVQ
jgi:O-antigen ligase